MALVSAAGVAIGESGCLGTQPKVGGMYRQFGDDVMAL